MCWISSSVMVSSRSCRALSEISCTRRYPGASHRSRAIRRSRRSSARSSSATVMRSTPARRRHSRSALRRSRSWTNRCSTTRRSRHNDSSMSSCAFGKPACLTRTHRRRPASVAWCGVARRRFALARVRRSAAADARRHRPRRRKSRQEALTDMPYLTLPCATSPEWCGSGIRRPASPCRAGKSSPPRALPGR